MEVNAKSGAKTEVDTVLNPSQEFVALQAILAIRNETISYEETAEIGYELLSFFEALGEENTSNEDDHA